MTFSDGVEIIYGLANFNCRKTKSVSAHHPGDKVMVQAICVHETGGPDVMRWEHIEVGEPGPGEARIRHTAVGLNFIDTYFRSGLYPAPAGVPFSPGNEGAGVVQTVGEGVTHLSPGDRVAYVGPLGATRRKESCPLTVLSSCQTGLMTRRCRHDAEGHDGTVSSAPDIFRWPGHDAAVSRCCREASA